jgi:hypothetical protein
MNSSDPGWNAYVDRRLREHQEWQEQPFYWTAPYETGCAPSGWYQWKADAGLVYLGQSILDGEE